jgi:hypothetical protein
MTLFRIATGDNWTDVMYVAQYGCKAYPSHDYSALSQSVSADDPDLSCKEPQVGGAFAVFYFIAFFVLGGLVFLNLFIGVVTAGMGDSMDAMDEDALADFVVERLHTRRTGNDVSVEVTDAFIAAFNALDVMEAGRLDLGDVQFALRCVHVFATQSELMKLARFAYEEVDHLSMAYTDGKPPSEDRLHEISKSVFILMLIDPSITQLRTDIGTGPLNAPAPRAAVLPGPEHPDEIMCIDKVVEDERVLREMIRMAASGSGKLYGKFGIEQNVKAGQWQQLTPEQKHELAMKEQCMLKLQRVLDENVDGQITMDEIQQKFHDFDVSGDGIMDTQEFGLMLQVGLIASRT